jgi:hypothetical protein
VERPAATIIVYGYRYIPPTIHRGSSLDYRPAGRGTTARRWVTPAGAPAASDYDGDDFAEIIAGDSLAGYQVEAFALVESPAVRLLTGYFAAVPHSAETQVLELRSNQISPSDFHVTTCHHGYPYCEAPRDEEDVHVPPAKFLSNGLLAAWEQVKRTWAPVITVKAARRRDCPA